MLQFRGIVVSSCLGFHPPHGSVVSGNYDGNDKSGGPNPSSNLQIRFWCSFWGGLWLLCETSQCVIWDLATYLPKTLWCGTHGTHMTLLTTKLTDTCGTTRRPERSLATPMKNKTKYHEHLYQLANSYNLLYFHFISVFTFYYIVLLIPPTTTKLAEFICWT